MGLFKELLNVQMCSEDYLCSVGAVWGAVSRSGEQQACSACEQGLKAAGLSVLAALHAPSAGLRLLVCSGWML